AGKISDFDRVSGGEVGQAQEEDKGGTEAQRRINPAVLPRKSIAIPGLWTHGLGGRDKDPLPTIQQRHRNRALAGSGQPWDTRTGPEDLAVLVRCDGPLTICDRSA